MDKKNLSFFFLRLPIAISLAGHGLVRLPKLHTFSTWMVGVMEKSILPSTLVTPFSYTLPFLEALIGISLLIGFQIKYILYAGFILMAILIFGSVSIENWEAVNAQLIHGIYLGIVLWWYENKY